MTKTARRGVALTPMETRADVVLRTAQLADELGYEVFSLAEGWGLDASAMLARLASQTRRITLLAGVLSIWGRTPGTIAMTAATLHGLSGGRFILGLGASTPQLVEGFHGVGYGATARHLRDVTGMVRSLLAGEPARAYGGSRPIRLGQAAAPDLPIWLAAAGDRTVRVAAELADGWMPIYLRREQYKVRLEELAAVRATAGLRADPLTLAAGPFTVADDDPAVAKEAVAACTARYLTAMGEVYPRQVAAQGLAAEVDQVRANRAVTAGAEARLDEFTAHGTPTGIADQLAAWDQTVDITMVGIPPGLPWSTIETTLVAAAP